MCYSRENSSNQDVTMYIYTGLIIGLIIMGCLRSLAFFTMTSLSSRNLHDKMFRVLLRAPISFFDKNPVGKS